jgi:hypothetical protein
MPASSPYPRAMDPLPAGSADHVRPASPDERSDVRGMHRATREAWDEAAERYEGWFDEAVELIRSAARTCFRLSSS